MRSIVRDPVMGSKRPITRSERAMMQPRNAKGQFAKEPTDLSRANGVLLYKGREPTQKELASRWLSENAADLIVVDESNSFSDMGNGRRKNLTVVCTRVRNRGGYDSVIDIIPNRKNIRSKYSNSREDDRLRIIRAIAYQDVDIVEKHRKIDSRKLSDSESKKRFYLDVLEGAVTAAVDLDPDRATDILIDSPPIKMDRELGDLGRRLDESGRNVRWFETRKSASDKHLTIHDFETGVVSDHVEGIRETDHLYSIIRRRVRNGNS